MPAACVSSSTHCRRRVQTRIRLSWEMSMIVCSVSSTSGDGGHDGKHGGAILPESLVWLWRGEAKLDKQ